MGAEIRTATTDAEMETWLSVRNAVDPRQLSLANVRAERSGDTTNLDLVAWREGTPCAVGSVGWGPVSEESRSTFLAVWVLPEHRTQGIGGRLYDQLATFARAGGMERVTGVVLDGDAAAIRFCERRGLVVDGGGSLGHLDLTRLDPDRPATSIDGVAITTLAASPDLERPMYDLEMLVHHEIPFLANEPLPSFEAWHATGVEDAAFVADLTLIALEGDRVIGSIELYDNADRTLFIGMTTVHPDARRRGIARLLKVELARRARAAGWRKIETYNDGANDRIRGLNESLGYVYDASRVVLRGPLTAPDPGQSA